MFQQPSFLEYMPKNTIQFMATIHRILQCFLEMLRFTVAVFPGLASAAQKGQQQTLTRTFSAGKLPVPKKGSLKAGLRPSQLILLQVIELHVTQVNVILHRKLGHKVMLEPQMANGFNRKGKFQDSRFQPGSCTNYNMDGKPENLDKAVGVGEGAGAKSDKCSLGWL